jgi:hypothetical protein
MEVRRSQSSHSSWMRVDAVRPKSVAVQMTLIDKGWLQIPQLITNQQESCFGCLVPRQVKSGEIADSVANDSSAARVIQER